MVLNNNMRSYNQNNQFAIKYKSSKARNSLCKRYCVHLAKGLSKECFPDCSHKTIETYMEKYPNDFPADMIAKAERNGRLFWEKAGIDGMFGKLKGFNSKIWSFNFKNRYGWKENPEQVNDDKIIVNFSMPPSQFIKNKNEGERNNKG